MAKDNLTPPTGKGKGKGKADDKDAAPKEQRARRSKFAELYPEDSKIKLLVKENPKKEGSAARERFEAYTGAKTVGDYLVAGGTYADLAYDIGRMHIQVDVVNKAA